MAQPFGSPIISGLRSPFARPRAPAPLLRPILSALSFNSSGIHTLAGLTYHGDSIAVADHEGLYRHSGANALPVEGARRVRNLITSPSDLTAGWTAGNGALVAADPGGFSTITFGGAVDARVFAQCYTGITAGEAQVVRFEVRADAPTTIRTRLAGGYVSHSVSTEWTTLAHRATATGDEYLMFYDQGDGGSLPVQIRRVQAENNTGAKRVELPGADSSVWLKTPDLSVDGETVNLPGEFSALYMSASNSAGNMLLPFEVGDVVSLEVQLNLPAGEEISILVGDNLGVFDRTVCLGTGADATYTASVTLTDPTVWLFLDKQGTTTPATAVTVRGGFLTVNGKALAELTPSEFVTGTQYRNTRNGTVVTDGNVVVDAVGPAFSAAFRPLLCPETTNVIPFSDDLSQWEVANTPGIEVDSSVTGERVPCRVEDSSLTLFDFVHITSAAFPANTAKYRLQVFVKKDPDATHSCGLVFELQGGSRPRSDITFSQKTGAWATRSGFATEDVRVIDAGDWWCVHLHATNDGTNTVARAVALPAIEKRVDPTGVWDLDAQGAATFSNFHASPQPGEEPLVATQGAAVTRSATYLSGSLSLLNKGEGGVSMKVDAGVDPATVNSTLQRPLYTAQGVNESPIQFRADAAAAFSVGNHDGTNWSANTAVASRSFSVATRWGNGEKQTVVDGVAAASGPYDGSFGVALGEVRIGGPLHGMLAPTAISDLKVWNKDPGIDVLSAETAA